MLTSEYIVNDGDTLRGAPEGSTLRASPTFKGRALVVLGSGSKIEDVAIEGSRKQLARELPIAPDDRTFASFYPNNGILAVNARDVSIRNIKLTQIASFAILISASREITIEGAHISDSGSLQAGGRNNTTGGILLEEGTTGFTVRDCVLERIPGNGVWTHSLYTSPRNADGRITGNRFTEIGRDAIQIGHATHVRVDHNTGSRIGYPHEVVDMQCGGMPVDVDTAGDVDHAVYEHNRFEEINGKCIDLDGFHDGEVRSNTCVNRMPAAHYPFGHFGIVFNNTNPDMQSENIRVSENVIDGTKFGGIFVIGRGHTIENNRLMRLNLARCNESHLKFGCIYNAEEPEILQTGIYLGQKAERPAIARENTIAGNVISGFKMSERCIAAAPRVDLKSNTIKGNECRNK